MKFGEKIPYESATLVPAVGNASNAAVAAARLGLSSALNAYVGDDRYGIECLEVLEHEQVDTSYMVTEPGKHTNYHYVLWYESERTILVKHEEFNYALPALESAPAWVYLTSLADNEASYAYQEGIIELLKQYPDTKLAFQPGTYQLRRGAEALRFIYERSELFFCNKEEAERILGHETPQEMPVLLSGIYGLGPRKVVITDGRNGAYASDGEHSWYVPMYPDTREPLERTGAGDSFASTVTSALALGKSFEEALLWGPINSMSVVQEIGAQKGLLTRDVLEKFLSDAPASYALTAL